MDNSRSYVQPGWLLLCATVFFVCTAASDSWFDIAVLTVLLAMASVLLKVKTSVLLNAIKSAWLLIVIAAGFHLVFRIWFLGEQNQVVLSSLLETLFFLCRLVLFISVSFLLLMQHSPALYAESVASRLRFVLGKKIAGNAGHVSMLALSMLSQLQEHMNQRRLARNIRQIRMSKSIGSRYARAQAELASAFRFALEYAGVLATVLWSRGFRPDQPIQLSKGRVTSRTGLSAAIAFCLLSLCTLLPLRIG